MSNRTEAAWRKLRHCHREATVTAPLLDSTLVDGNWVRIYEQVSFSNFWVDICHAAPLLIDERYYFPDLASAMDFYLEGWKERQFENPDGSGQELDHSGLYSRGRLIHGSSIHGDLPCHEGENLRRILEEYARKLDES